MQIEIGSHASEEFLESYAMRSLAVLESESLEDHLMFCPVCQDQLESVESFLLVARQASRLVRKENPSAQIRTSIWSRFAQFLLGSRYESKNSRSWLALPISAVALACLALFLIVPSSQDLAYQPVRLEAVRGAEAGLVSSKQPLEIAVSLAGLPASSAYRVEIVRSDGESIATSMVRAEGDSLTFRVKSKLRPGQYWVRLYAPGSDETLREFSLHSN